ncbi:hypothetical protein [Pseudoxanthomonas mexicana]
MAAPFSLESQADKPMAHLNIGERPGHPVDPAYNGIWLIDNREIPNGPVQSILVSPGKRKVDYICPGIMVLDGYQTASADFIAGEQYEISCENEPGIKVVRGGA